MCITFCSFLIKIHANNKSEARQFFKLRFSSQSNYLTTSVIISSKLQNFKLTDFFSPSSAASAAAAEHNSPGGPNAPKRCKNNQQSSSVVIVSAADKSDATTATMNQQSLLDFSRFNTDEYPIEDCDETARNQRAREIAEGVDPPPGYLPAAPIINRPQQQPQLPMPASIIQQAIAAAAARAAAAAASSAAATTPSAMMVAAMSAAAVNAASGGGGDVAAAAATLGSIDDAALHMVLPHLVPHSDDMPKLVIHSQVKQICFLSSLCTINQFSAVSLLQVDYIHCLVPDLKKITNCGFYWGKMDRYEAERLLDGKPEGL